MGAVAFIVLLATAMPRPEQAPTFSTRVEAVRVDVLVTILGVPVRDLAAADFQVFDNGVAQRVDFATLEELPVNVVLTLDLSASVRGEHLDHLRSAAGVVLDGLRRDDRAALITFSHAIALRRDLSTDLGAVRRALVAATAAGDTALIDGAYAGLMLADADTGRSLVLVFSDGLDTSSWLQPRAVLEAARRCNAVVYAVSSGASPAPAFLRDLSRATGGTLFEVVTTRDLAATFSRILAEFRQRYVLSYSPRGVQGAGWHALEVRVRRAHVTVKARPGYVADTPRTVGGR